MSIETVVISVIVLVLAIVLYLRRSLKRAEANFDRLKEEADAALFKEQERLEQKRVTDRK